MERGDFVQKPSDYWMCGNQRFLQRVIGSLRPETLNVITFPPIRKFQIIYSKQVTTQNNHEEICDGF